MNKKNKVEYCFKWIFLLFVMYCVLTIPLIIYTILVLPKIDWLIGLGISPIALICSIFGIFFVSGTLAFKMGEFIGLNEQLEILNDYLINKKIKELEK